MKLLIYDDNPGFGGHQLMAAHGIEALIAEPSLDVVIMHNPFNRKLAERLSRIKGIRTLEAPCSTQRFQGLRNRMDKSGVEILKEHFLRVKPDLILCIQGDIEQSSQALLAARSCRIECVSYIAIPHRLVDKGAKLGKFRDSINRPLLNKPTRYITISESMKELLKARRTRRDIRVVENGIESPPIPKLTAHDSRFTIGLIGRIEFSQKQQNFFVRSFLKHPAAFANCRVLIVGSGPDEHRLRRLIKGHNPIAHLPWQENIEEIYEVLDMLAIPSRYEGMPLVMLEALARGIPVIGSRRDGMKDLLPDEWTFSAESSASLAATFSSVRNTWQKKTGGLQEQILKNNRLEDFKQKFVEAVISP